MRRLTVLGFLGVVLLSVGACGGDDDEGSVGEAQDAADGLVTALCDCAAENGVSEADCREEFGDDFDFELNDCEREVVNSEPAVRRALDCLVDAFNEARSCVEASECDDAGLNACEPNLAPCAPPADVQARLDACEPQFTCANGELVPESFVCDEFDDCGDNSDEANCAL